MAGRFGTWTVAEEVHLSVGDDDFDFAAGEITPTEPAVVDALARLCTISRSRTVNVVDEAGHDVLDERGNVKTEIESYALAELTDGPTPETEQAETVPPTGEQSAPPAPDGSAGEGTPPAGPQGAQGAQGTPSAEAQGAQGTPPAPPGAQGAQGAQGSTPPAEKPLYLFNGTGTPDPAVWSKADVETTDTPPKTLYNFAGDTPGGEPPGASAEWTVFTGPTQPATTPTA